MQDSTPALLTAEEAARYLTLKPSKFKRIRLSGQGPKETWLSERILRFRKVDLDLWIQSRVTK